MSQDTLASQLDEAAGLTLDATCALRAAGVLALPVPHRDLVASAITALESAQIDLFHARNSGMMSANRSPSALTVTPK